MKMLVAQKGKNVFPRRKSRTCRDKGLVCRLVRPSRNGQLCRCDTGRHTAVTLFVDELCEVLPLPRPGNGGSCGEGWWI